jgi:hypothetical protein
MNMPPGQPGPWQGPPAPPHPGPGGPYGPPHPGPGGPYGPYGPPAQYAPPPPARQNNKRTKIAVAVAVPVLIGLFVAFVAVAPETSAPTGEWKAGQCVTPAGRVGDQEGKTFRRTGCDASDAAAKVTKMTASGRLTGSPTDCPEDTDAIVGIDQSHSRLNLTANVACVRNIDPPHPGDVGQGGGMFRAGDCIPDPDRSSTLKETPCASEHWGTVIRWAPDAQSCPHGASYDAVSTLAAERTLCVRRAP